MSIWTGQINPDKLALIGAIEYHIRKAELSTTRKSMILTTPVKIEIGLRTCALHAASNKRKWMVEVDTGTCHRTEIICANGIDGGLSDDSGLSISTTKRGMESRDLSA